MTGAHVALTVDGCDPRVRPVSGVLAAAAMKEKGADFDTALSSGSGVAAGIAPSPCTSAFASKPSLLRLPRNCSWR
ncbi:hypothetical protein Y1Q_0005836 [Alligator mississippiensis]|uniref:Uncharacterized protein n=1 Tax=Alligator mississippiensis TaxID=8496 RepID=A0A151MG54_ALLMI|nr:hypothetical protein Y1Q_0005836 [Alligator mississippiensis]